MKNFLKKFQKEIVGILLILAGFYVPKAVGVEFFHQHLVGVVFVALATVSLGGILIGRGLFPDKKPKFQFVQKK